MDRRFIQGATLAVALILLAGCGALGHAQDDTQLPIAVPGSSKQSTASPRAIVHFVYVANSASNNVFAYAFNARTGALKQLRGSPFAAGEDPERLVIDPSGKVAFVVNVYSDNVCAYIIGGTGALKQVKGSPFGAG
ncbi:MAG: beta-propeller fold lactonase family protein [Candidatus Cybelea sp.]